MKREDRLTDLNVTPLEAGSPYPLGATWMGDGINFALFSAHATRVELCLFDSTGRNEIGRVDLPEYTDEVWHGFMPGAEPGLVYGYRVHGPYAPEEGHRFNPNKLLLDPYATELVGRLRWGHAIFGYDMRSRRPGHGFSRTDSAPYMYKARVTVPTSRPARRPALRTPWDQTIIYELHVRGFTRQHTGVPPRLRGTYAGLGSPAVTDYLKALGVTTVELLPVHAFVDDGHLLDKGLRNYWGYNSLAFFALEPRYLSGTSRAEFHEMVARLHDAGLEVILDVVYNHTPEGNELGPTLSFKGLDNASYYRLQAENPQYYINDTGTGNTVNLSHPRVLQLVLDSLRYWVLQMGVDGFRFDLATILAREYHGFDHGSGFLDACRQDPVLNRVKLIAEPWDIGPGGYQVGAFQPGWAEWNDRYRDTTRAFWRGDEGQSPSLATRLTASADCFNYRGRRPWASVNFITAHDGFTLHDLVSYNDKHNEANGEENRDGHNENRSWNCGAEGTTDDPEVLELRERQKRNLLATLLFSHGTPMLVAGDEFGRTQLGNNNAYCQDNEISWVNWAGVDSAGMRLLAFVRQVIALRKAIPVLRPPSYASGRVIWLNPLGAELQTDDWNNGLMRSFGMLANSEGEAKAGAVAGTHWVTLLVFNASHEGVEWTLPTIPGKSEWVRAIDTALPEANLFATFSAGEKYIAGGRSMLLFVASSGPEEAALVRNVRAPRMPVPSSETRK
ncbi:glycogen debranching protein GlgX [Propionivibrio soli]|uniref:glycogen debranching protein GlgX n=1 Tax=Propionivibrio soli TaxID=2976531 RepID=UPI0021E98818|nr:glycogen debranching protein GlgX [Propionivibrio soli]